jgi:hypothetical protein
MKKRHATIIGALVLPFFAICCLQLFIWFDFPNGINRHISGYYEVPPAVLYFVLSWFHVPMGAALGFMTACLFQISIGEKLKRIAVFGAGLLFATLFCFMLPILGRAFSPSGSKYFDVIAVTLWLGLPAIWSLSLFVKGLISLNR